MSWHNFPSDEGSARPTPIFGDKISAGAGDHLPVWLLALCGSCTAVATAVSVMSITLQLKNYRKPTLQRCVVRIMIMVPLYAISSLIAIFSLEAAFIIDAIRDLYEAFVIYTFFQLLITYLGGERSLLIILHGRPPVPHPFPVNLFLRPMDVSDPWTLLNLKRGVLQYVQVKPVLVVATIILKLTGTYREGKFAPNSGYTYVSIVYNTSICLSLYCLAMFWVCVNKDLKPFRPVPKFLCVKGILFFSFWQGIGISFLVAVGAIKHVGVYRDPEHMSQAIVDALICFEMPIFAVAHQYAFQASDYIDSNLGHQARLPFIYALRDAFGLKDVWQDTKDTFRGRGISYQAYEPAEGSLHFGAGRQKRIRAGLRYSKGGKAKYWIPMPGEEARNRGDRGPIASLKQRVDKRLAQREGYAPLLPKQAAEVVHDDPDRDVDGRNMEWQGLSTGLFADSDSDGSDAASLDFESVSESEDTMYERARRIGYAGFPNIDVSGEEAKRRRWEEEEEILAGRGGRAGPSRQNNVPAHLRQKLERSYSKGKGKVDSSKRAVYGAWADRDSPNHKQSNGHARPPISSNPTGEGEWLIDPEVQRKAKSHNTPNGEVMPSKGKSTGRKSRRSRTIVHDVTAVFKIGDDEEDDSASDAHDDDPGSARPGMERQSTMPRLPSDARDLVVEDNDAVEEARARERRRGEPQSKAPAHVYVHRHDPDQQRSRKAQKAPSPPMTAKDVRTGKISPSRPDERLVEVDEIGEGDAKGEIKIKENRAVTPPVEIEEVYSPALPEDRRLSETIPQSTAPGGDPMKQIGSIEEVAESRPVSSIPHLDEDNPWA